MPSDTYYYNTLNIVDKAISSDAYIHVSLLECPEQTSLRRKIVNLFKKEYHKVYNKKLFYSKYNDLTSQNTELVYSSPSAIDFQYIVFLNPTDFYCPTFFDLIPDIISGEYNIKIMRSKEMLMDWNEWARKVLWFGHRSGNYMYNVEEINKFNKQKN